MRTRSSIYAILAILALLATFSPLTVAGQDDVLRGRVGDEVWGGTNHVLFAEYRDPGNYSILNGETPIRVQAYSRPPWKILPTPANCTCVVEAYATGVSLRDSPPIVYLERGGVNVLAARIDEMLSGVTLDGEVQGSTIVLYVSYHYTLNLHIAWMNRLVVELPLESFSLEELLRGLNPVEFTVYGVVRLYNLTENGTLDLLWEKPAEVEVSIRIRGDIDLVGYQVDAGTMMTPAMYRFEGSRVLPVYNVTACITQILGDQPGVGGSGYHTIDVWLSTSRENAGKQTLGPGGGCVWSLLSNEPGYGKLGVRVGMGTMLFEREYEAYYYGYTGGIGRGTLSTIGWWGAVATFSLYTDGGYDVPGESVVAPSRTGEYGWYLGVWEVWMTDEETGQSWRGNCSSPSPGVSTPSGGYLVHGSLPGMYVVHCEFGAPPPPEGRARLTVVYGLDARDTGDVITSAGGSEPARGVNMNGVAEFMQGVYNLALVSLLLVGGVAYILHWLGKVTAITGLTLYRDALLDASIRAFKLFVLLLLVPFLHIIFAVVFTSIQGISQYTPPELRSLASLGAGGVAPYRVFELGVSAVDGFLASMESGFQTYVVASMNSMLVKVAALMLIGLALSAMFMTPLASIGGGLVSLALTVITFLVGMVLVGAFVSVLIAVYPALLYIVVLLGTVFLVVGVAALLFDVGGVISERFTAVGIAMFLFVPLAGMIGYTMYNYIITNAMAAVGMDSVMLQIVGYALSLTELVKIMVYGFTVSVSVLLSLGLLLSPLAMSGLILGIESVIHRLIR